MEAIEKFLMINNGDGSGYGSGYGDGSGYGYGSGYGDGDGYGDGSGYGSGSGYGDGSGYGSGYGDGSGYGSGYGDGDGSGYGYGYGDGSGYGYGYGDGDGYSDGDGSGYGDGLKSIGGKRIYKIDGVPTVITSARGGVATGFIVQSDLTLTLCYIVKENNRFAHGENLHEAYNDLMEKLYDDSSEEERLEKFREHFPDFSRKYPAEDLFVWHHVLTGSCRAGREAFCRDRGIDIKNNEYTVYEFIEITKDAYGGDIIRKL